MTDTRSLYYGLMGGVTSVPADTTVQFIVFYSSAGVNKVREREKWGGGEGGGGGGEKEGETMCVCVWRGKGRTMLAEPVVSSGASRLGVKGGEKVCACLSLCMRVCVCVCARARACVRACLCL